MVRKPVGETELVQQQCVPQEDMLRARVYALLSSLLAATPGAEALQTLSTLEGDKTDAGQAVVALAETAGKTASEALEREFFELFIGVTQGELVPYASYYLTGFLQEKPLADLRHEMASLGIARSDESHEPEDHIASLLEMMHGLITGRFDDPADNATQCRFFDAHIGPWAPQFFVDLEAANSAVFYAPVGAIGRLFMEIESQAFRLST